VVAHAIRPDIEGSIRRLIYFPAKALSGSRCALELFTDTVTILTVFLGILCIWCKLQCLCQHSQVPPSALKCTPAFRRRPAAVRRRRPAAVRRQNMEFRAYFCHRRSAPRSLPRNYLTVAAPLAADTERTLNLRPTVSPDCRYQLHQPPLPGTTRQPLPRSQ
jgi:hypothetical protein